MLRNIPKPVSGWEDVDVVSFVCVLAVGETPLPLGGHLKCLGTLRTKFTNLLFNTQNSQCKLDLL